MYLQKAKLDISNDNEKFLIGCIFKTKSGHKVSKTKGISYFRIKEIFKGYISEITTTLENFVYTVLDQVVHHHQPITASQIG